jgi:hypothetical protein
MKSAYFTLMFLFLAITLQVCGQSDTSAAARLNYTHHDSLYAAKLNYTGNLMIGGGVGLAGAGTFLIYEGVKIYQTPASPSSTDPAGDVQRNHNQGTAYLAAGGIAYAGAVVLIALGVKNKLEFKRRKKLMSLQSGLLPSGNMGAMLTF